MQVTNASWQLVGDATPTTLLVQNTGHVRIAYVFAASAPAVDAYDLDKDEHFIFNPDHPTLSFGNLATEGLSMYARALGPKAGYLAVASYAP